MLQWKAIRLFDGLVTVCCLCRLNKVEEVMNAVYAKDSGRHAQENLFNENSYLLAIPQGAIDQNENLIQNPGY